MDDLQKKATLDKQMETFARAQAIFEERTRKFGELWKEVELEDTAHNIRHKANRCYFVAKRKESGEATAHDSDRAVESALDLINYAAFFIRKLEGDSFTLKQAEQHPAGGDDQPDGTGGFG